MRKGNRIVLWSDRNWFDQTEITTLSDQVLKVSQTLVNTVVNITVIVDFLE